MTYEELCRSGGAVALQQAESFLMQRGPVYETLRRIASRLDELKIPYAVAGGMALVAHGYERTTSDVDILVSSESLRILHEQLEGLGYVAPFAGSKNLRDTTTGVRIEFLIEAAFPGDGKPKPVAFPDSTSASIEMNGIRYLTLDRLIELKLASGISAPHRLKDLADVQELIRLLKLPHEFASRLNPYVQGKFIELWEALAQAGEE